MKIFTFFFLIFPVLFLVTLSGKALAFNPPPMATNSPYLYGVNPACGEEPCSTGESCCTTSCVDMNTDAGNCGACGNVCEEGNTCTNGSCVVAGDPCDETPDIRTECIGGALYTGTYNESKYMTTPTDGDGEMSWDSAVTYCQNLNFGGYTDWFLPDIGELYSVLYLHKDVLGGFQTQAVSGYEGNGVMVIYWTSETNLDFDPPHLAYVRGFIYGNHGNIYKTAGAYVRCVRKY